MLCAFLLGFGDSCYNTQVTNALVQTYVMHRLVCIVYPHTPTKQNMVIFTKVIVFLCVFKDLFNSGSYVSYG